MQSITKLWRFLALTLLNTLVLVVLVNGVCHVILRGQDTTDEEVAFLRSVIDHRAYSGPGSAVHIDSAYAQRMVNGYLAFLIGGGPEFAYHPATEFQHALTRTPGYNLHPPHPAIDFNTRPCDCGPGDWQQGRQAVFCFGGSTTLGILVDDAHTWPRFLQQMLDSIAPGTYCVVNFGSGSYNPTQETDQLIYLLKQGHRPAIALFMDGVNVGPVYDGSEFSSRIAQRFNLGPAGLHSLPDVLADLPAVRLLKGQGPESLDIFKTDNYDMVRIETSAEYNAIIAQRFLENARIRQAMGKLYGVPVLSFLQPNGYINYPYEHFSAFGKEYISSPEGRGLKANYTDIYGRILGADTLFTDLSFLFDTYGHHAIIDLVHYGPDFNRYLAREVMGYLRLPLDGRGFDAQRSTGHAFVPNL